MATELGAAFGRAAKRAKKRANKIDYVGLAKQQFLLEGVKGISNLLVTPVIAGTQELAKDIFVDPYTEKRANFLAQPSQKRLTNMNARATKQQPEMISMINSAKNLGSDSPYVNYYVDNQIDTFQSELAKTALTENGSPIDLSKLDETEQKNLFKVWLTTTNKGKKTLEDFKVEVDRRAKIALPTESSYGALKPPSNMFSAGVKKIKSFFKEDFDEQTALNNLVATGGYLQKGASKDKNFAQLENNVKILNEYFGKSKDGERDLNGRVAAQDLFYRAKENLKDANLIRLGQQLNTNLKVKKEFVIEDGSLVEKETIQKESDTFGENINVKNTPLFNFTDKDKDNERKYVGYLQGSNLSIASQLAQFGNNNMPKNIQDKVFKLYEKDPDFWAAPSSKGKRPVDIISQDMTYDQFVAIKRLIIKDSDSMLTGKKSEELEVEIYKSTLAASQNVLKEYKGVREIPKELADYDDSWMFKDPNNRLSPLNSNMTMLDSEGRIVLNEDYIKKTNPNKAREDQVLKHVNSLFTNYKGRMDTADRLVEAINSLGRLQKILYDVSQGKSDIEKTELLEKLLSVQVSTDENQNTIVNIPFGNRSLLGKQ